MEEGQLQETVYGNSKEKCCGCTACKSVCPCGAIQMQSDKEGFIYPVIAKEKCIECKRCLQVCPFQERTQKPHSIQQVVGAKHLNDQIRQQSSSGGAFSAISDLFLKKNGVVYGCAYDHHCKAVHIRAENEEMRDRCRGSKYVQSDMGDTFPAVQSDLLSGKWVLFSGTPCQVAGLKCYLGKEYPNLYTLDCLCHGVPSPVLFSEHIKMIEKRAGSKVTAYYNRSKARGWGNHVEEVHFANGRVDNKSIHTQAFKHLFYSHLALRPSCYACPYASGNRPGDITIGDFWGVEKSIPGYKDEQGVSLILFNTRKALELKEEICKKMDVVEVYDDAYIQPVLLHPVQCPPQRQQFWKDYFCEGYLAVIRKYAACNARGYVKTIIKRMMGRPE